MNFYQKYFQYSFIVESFPMNFYSKTIFDQF